VVTGLIPIEVTRALVEAALSGDLKNQPMRTDPVFGFAVPVTVAGVDPKLLTPRDTWADPHAYDAMTAKLAQMFHDNFAKFAPYVDADVLRSSPVGHPRIAAE
jgi:phosphoenolpyruvate carboxykinase (ATP)